MVGIYRKVAISLRTNVGAHFLIVDAVPAVLGVPAHGSSTVAFVVVVRSLLGGESQAADGAEERLGGLHRGRFVVETWAGGGRDGGFVDVCGVQLKTGVSTDGTCMLM